MNSSIILFELPFILAFFLFIRQSQQAYEGITWVECFTGRNEAYGNPCNGLQPSCFSYLAFRAAPPYDSITSIGNLLNSDPTMIAQQNNISDEVKIPENSLIIVPITNCSCSGKYYQHNSNYTLRAQDYYFKVANKTYQGLTTCHDLNKQNPSHDSRNLSIGIQILVPIRCACPTQQQTSNGVKFLLSYASVEADSFRGISVAFGVDEQSLFDANGVSEMSALYPFTTILVPLKTQPHYKPQPQPQPRYERSQTPTLYILSPKKARKQMSSLTKTFIGIGSGSFILLLLLFGFLYFYLYFVRQPPFNTDCTNTAREGSESALLSSKSVRHLANLSFNVYNFDELQTATDDFSEDNIIKNSVYYGDVRGHEVGIKKMKGGVLNEIMVLNQIHHSSLNKLSGYCIHEDCVYFVYEYAENGSLEDWLNERKLHIATIAWKQRVQIACDVADGLNHLHNYATPPYIHMDLRSSNILLDGSFRAKIANFGMVTRLRNQGEEGAADSAGSCSPGCHIAPEYTNSTIVSQKLDVFAFGVMLLELLSGKEANTFSDNNNEITSQNENPLFAAFNQVREGENWRENLRKFIDPNLKNEYPLGLAFSMAQLAKSCISEDSSSRPTMSDVFITLSKISSSSLAWDRMDAFQRSFYG